MTHGVSRRFTGTGRVYGERAVARFSAAHVCVVGIGGVGSWAAEALCRSAIGRITLIDPDTVAESNTNRQIHALGDNYDKAKTLIMAERLRSINPACQVSAVERRVTPETLDELLAGDGKHSLRALLARLDVLYVDAAELRAADPQLRSFFDLDTPADLAAATR